MHYGACDGVAGESLFLLGFWKDNLSISKSELCFLQEKHCFLSDTTLFILGHPKPKKMLIFRFVGIFEYIILLMLTLFLDMCQNS